MTKIPWHFCVPPEPQCTYWVVATSGLAVAWWNLPKILAFQRATLEIVAQLRQAPGCVGFALRATLRPLGGATLSVWADPAAIRQFQKTHPHGTAVTQLGMGPGGQFRYRQWACLGAALPRTWAEAADPPP